MRVWAPCPTWFNCDRGSGLADHRERQLRAGPLGTVRLGWTPTYQTISNLEAP